MILAAIIIAKNPAQYGFDVAPHAPVPTETVDLPAAVDLRRVAEWAGVAVDDIQRLNPELRRWTTPVREGHYTLKVPEGTAARIQGGLCRIGAQPVERAAVAHGEGRRIAGHHRAQAAREP